jgi:hypothetical protein
MVFEWEIVRMEGQSRSLGRQSSHRAQQRAGDLVMTTRWWALEWEGAAAAGSNENTPATERAASG